MELSLKSVQFVFGAMILMLKNFQRFGAVKERFVNFVVPYEARKFYKHINDEEE